jgi:hypothetical protein
MERIPSHTPLTKRAVALAQLLILFIFAACNEPTITRKLNFIEIDSLSPESGLVDGGTLLTIEGSELQYVTSVTIDGDECTSLTVSEDELTCLTPSHVEGAATVRILSSKDGAVTGSFTYTLPELEGTSYTPNLTPSTGGGRLTIRGEGFSSGMIVTIGGVTCPSVVVDDSTRLSCTIPPLSAGNHSVVIEDPEGETVTFTRKLTAAATPVVTAINPVAGSSNGGTVVTITGTDFENASVVIGGVTCAISARSSTSITCTTGARTAALTYLKISNSSGISVNISSAYTYVQAPVPTSITPAIGVPAGGETVTINGANFKSPALVSIGGVSCTPVTFVSSSQLTCVTGVNVVGTYDVVVTNSDTYTGKITNGFEYRELPPTLTSVAPSVGVIGGGETITLTGTGFRTGATVTIDGVDCTSPNILSATSMECDTPASLTEGAKDVIVANSDGQTATLLGGFTYVGPPTISSVSPPGGTTAGGNTITITGTNFNAGLTVTVGGLVCDNIIINSTTEMTCEPRAHVAGAEDIVVTNTDLQAGTGSGIYLYADAPTVTSVAPDGGPAAGGVTVRINGTNFQSTATVKFDTDDCTPVTFVSSTQLDCVTPAHLLGAVAVEVTNPDLQSGSLAAAYTYQVPPTLSSVTPAGGTTAGGTSITLTGTDFLTGATVKIGTDTCAVTAESATSITCTTPAHVAGANDVTITNPDNQAATLTNGFTYLAPPTVTSVSPDSGALAGGTTVTVTGTGFFTGATVDFDGADCGTVLVTSSTTLTCVTSLHAAGSVIVTVTNIDGQSGGAGSAYTYSPAPAITAVSPVAGALAGSTSVTITGTDFVSGATVDFGGSPCTVTSTAATQIVCTTTSHVAGAVDVTITNPDNQFVTSSGAYTYQPAPTVTGASPAGISISGGNTLTITGTNFVAGADVKVGGVDCTVTALTSTSIDCTTGAHAAGVAGITVTNDDTQTASLGSAVTFIDPPTVSGISPSSGRLAGGGTLTITGTNFFAGAAVEINSQACVVVTQTDTQITCTLPANVAGTYDVIVTNVDAQAVNFSSYVYQPAPTVTAVAFDAGAIAGGTNVTVQGTDFLSGATVKFGGLDCPVSATTATTIDCVTPAHAAGTVNILVTNPDAQTGTLLNGYTYQVAPVVSTVSPAVGSALGGTTVTITGTGFRTTPSVSIGSANCNVTASTSTSITCTTSARAAATVDVQVTNLDSQSGIKSNSFTYLDAPTVASISQDAGALNGGATVVITGTNFYTGASVSFGGSSCTVTALSSTSITCRTTAHAAGVVAVTVTNIDSQSDSLAAAFTYRAAPVVSSVSPSFGPIGGGTTITITGTGFVSGQTVTVGAADCTVSAESATSITCDTTLSMVSGSATVRVTNPVDLQTGSKTNAFIYLMPPTITSISPSAGALAGGKTITIRGTGFYPGATVTVGGSACTSPNISSDTVMTCVTPAGAAGAADVVLTNGDGQTVTKVSGFTYQAAPTVIGISPASGPLAGNSLVTITGTGFVSGASVKIGGSTCTSVVVGSSASLTCRTPPGLNGVADVKVTNADGQTDTSPGLYEYQAGPTISSVAPAGGPLAGGTTITVTGTFLRTGATVLIGGSACGSVTVDASETFLTCVTPAKSAGAYTVSVTNTDTQVASKASGFTYQGAPTVTNISPAVGASAGNTLVTISGSNFLSGATVSIGGTACTPVTVASATSLSCRTGVHAAGSGTITVTNADGQFGTGSSYLYQDAPAITSVTPATSAVTGGQAITITGTGFLTGATVKIGGTSCTSVVVVSLTEITCTTGAKTAGTFDLVVMNTDTQTGTLTSGFVYQGAPVVSGVSPTLGDVSGGQVLTITGTSFITGATVKIGGTSCAVSAVSATSITCTTGAKVAGLYSLVVTNPDSQTGTKTSAFTYVDAPTVISVSPVSGTTVGGTTVTITGTYFYSGASVDFGGSACTSVTITSTTSLTCVTPANAAGAVTVSVISAFSTTGTLPSGYTYVSSPATISFVTGSSSPTPPNPDSYGTTSTNITHTFTLTNTGGSATSADLAVTIGGADPAAWAIGTDTCSGAALASAGTCTVQVTFLGAFVGTGTFNGTVSATATTGGSASNVITGKKP